MERLCTYYLGKLYFILSCMCLNHGINCINSHILVYNLTLSLKAREGLNYLEFFSNKKFLLKKFHL